MKEVESKMLYISQSIYEVGFFKLPHIFGDDVERVSQWTKPRGNNHYYLVFYKICVDNQEWSIYVANYFFCVATLLETALSDGCSYVDLQHDCGMIDEYNFSQTALKACF